MADEKSGAPVKCFRGLRYILTVATFMLVMPIICLGGPSLERTYGGLSDDYGFSIQETFDGGYVIAGCTRSFGAGAADAYLIKTDSLGDTVWTRTYGGSREELANCVQQTSDGGYVVVGSTTSFDSTDADVYLLKVDSLGKQSWMKTYGGGAGEEGKCVQQTMDGGYVVVAWTVSFGRKMEVYLVRTDSVGNELWSKTLGGPRADKPFCIQQTWDGGYVVAGWTFSFGAGGCDVYLVRTDSLGDTVWTRTYGGMKWDGGHSVRQTPDGGYVIAGYTRSFGKGNGDVYLVRADSLGRVLWTRTYGSVHDELGWSVDVARDGGFLIAGAATPGALYLIRTNPQGDTLRTWTYGGHRPDVGMSVREASDGGCIAAGYTSSFGHGGYDVYLVKTEPIVDTTCHPIEPPRVKSQGYWRSLCRNDVQEDICGYVDCIHLYADLFDGFNCDSITNLMRINPPENDMCRKAKRQFIAMLLNVASGKLATCNCLEDGREVEDVIAEIDSLLSDRPDFHMCERAKTLADDINNGISIVPCDALLAQASLGAADAPAISVTPNPFARSALIECEVKSAEPVRLEIYDKVGRLTRTLFDGQQTTGTRFFEWDGLDDGGQRVPIGIYFSRLQAGGNISSAKLVLVN
jgi:hypothetical protein